MCIRDSAWDALYHRYQVTLYWFTEVHNHFAQVLVETGYPGFIAFTAFWILVLIMGLKAWKLARDAHKEIKMKISEDATEVASEITAEAKPGTVSYTHLISALKDSSKDFRHK